jgi:peptidoglycan/xylan/chitin deacetylase (PgdA/CDA1 family)
MNTASSSPVRVLIVWDYDGAVGQVNASYPYNFDESKIYREIESVERILSLAAALEVRMTFACLGFAAEPGTFPYHVPEQIRRIREAGHEVASHSWRHEWFPLLERGQIERSLARSKLTLEACTGGTGEVVGFVPPFSRPMGWLARGAVSRGDRAFGPRYPGSDLGKLLRFVGAAGYRWCRITCEPAWRKLWRGSDALLRRLSAAWPTSGGVRCVPHHYSCFDAAAHRLLDAALARGATLVLNGHPSGLTRQGTESERHLESFLERLAREQRAGAVETATVAGHLGLAPRRAQPT